MSVGSGRWCDRVSGGADSVPPGGSDDVPGAADELSDHSHRMCARCGGNPMSVATYAVSAGGYAVSGWSDDVLSSAVHAMSVPTDDLRGSEWSADNVSDYPSDAVPGNPYGVSGGRDDADHVSGRYDHLSERCNGLPEPHKPNTMSG